MSLLLLAVGCVAQAEIIPADRKIDWQPGIPGGIPDSSSWTMINVKNSPFNAKGDGVADDTAAIQSALNSAGVSNVVYIPAGTYRITSGLYINYNIPKHHVVIRGQGPSTSKLIYAGTGAGAIIGIQNTEGGMTDNLLGGYTKGSTTLSVTDSTKYSIGDLILVDQLNDPNLVNTIGEGYHSRNSGTRTMGQIVKVTGKSGNSVTINRPLYFTFQSGLTPQAYGVYAMNRLSSYIGIENLYMETASDTGSDGIGLNHVPYCWVKNVEGNKVGAVHVRTLWSYACEIRDSYFHHGQTYNSGSGYGISLEAQTTDVLAENNILYYLRHSANIESGGCGNVIGYNYALGTFDDQYPNTGFMMGALLSHGAHPYMNLYEGNIAPNLYHDNVHGSSSHNTTFRNHLTSYGLPASSSILYELRAYAADQNNYFENVVGNILNAPGQTGFYETNNYPVAANVHAAFKNGWVTVNFDGLASDPKVNATILRHGNFSYLDNTVRWDSNITERSLVSSYYLSAKPQWWGNMPWPAIGPDVSGYVNDIPAKVRFGQIQNPTLPAPPANLRVTTVSP